MTWAFATGECGSENWGGVQRLRSSPRTCELRQQGKKYIISTGGAAGSFTCGSDAGFETFIQRYNSSRLTGIDFDIEAGQSRRPSTTSCSASRPRSPGIRACASASRSRRSAATLRRASGTPA